MFRTKEKKDLQFDLEEYVNKVRMKSVGLSVIYCILTKNLFDRKDEEI